MPYWSDYNPLKNATIHFGSADPKDEPSAWAKDEVASAISAGLVPENMQENYQSAISRGDVAEMFVNLLEKSKGESIAEIMAEKNVAPDKNAFKDTTDEAVLAANALGIINGTGNGNFSPDGNLTRAQIAAIINRVAGVLGVDTSGYTHSFTDVTGHWVSAELGWPVHAGIINGVGDNKFDPDTMLTTEQAIAITYRALQVFKGTVKPSETSAAPGKTAASAGTLSLSGISYFYSEDETVISGNPGAVGAMRFDMTVEGPEAVETVLIAGFFEKPLAEQNISELLAQQASMLKAENTPLMLKSVPFYGGCSAPVFQDYLGKTMYYVFAGYDKDANPIAYAVAPAMVGASGQTAAKAATE